MHPCSGFLPLCEYGPFWGSPKRDGVGVLTLKTPPPPPPHHGSVPSLMLTHCQGAGTAIQSLGSRYPLAKLATSN